MKNITMSDIAKKTGFSVNTVSHALNDKPDISQKTKDIIRKTAEKMGYIANTSAQTLRSGKSKCIAIIVGDISNPHFSILIKEMQTRLHAYGYAAILFNTDEDETLERIAITSALSKGVDGMLLCPAQKSKKNIEFLKTFDIPFILFGRRFEDIPTNFVICDDENGGYTAAEFLLNRNHKKLLFVNAPNYISSAKERLDGAVRAVKERNLPAEVLKCAVVSPTGAEKAIPEILNINSDCTGIICFSDLIAMQVCYFLKQKNKSVPRDVSVIGFDNIASKFKFPLMITSVTSSKTKMSITAVEYLMLLINSPKLNHLPNYQKILSTKIVERESTEFFNK